MKTIVFLTSLFFLVKSDFDPSSLTEYTAVALKTNGESIALEQTKYNEMLSEGFTTEYKLSMKGVESTVKLKKSELKELYYRGSIKVKGESFISLVKFQMIKEKRVALYEFKELKRESISKIEFIPIDVVPIENQKVLVKIKLPSNMSAGSYALVPGKSDGNKFILGTITHSKLFAFDIVE